MPIVTKEEYLSMLNKANKHHFAFAAINVTSPSSANAVLEAFEEEKSDGIIQISTGGASFMSGFQKDSILGAISLAEHVHRMAAKLSIGIALHTDHCPPNKVDSFLNPLLKESEKRVSLGQKPLFQSHMFDGAELPLSENLKISKKLHQQCCDLGIILEVETGVVGGEEDGINNEHIGKEKLYTTPAEMIAIYKELFPMGPFMYAATFGNVHGVYKPGNVKLRPSILKEGQEAILKEFGNEARLHLVFHGGSGSELSEIHETLQYGVIKMNIDTDTQYAYSKGALDHFFKYYDQCLKIEGDVGNKKYYDPREWLKKSEKKMKERVVQSIKDLKSSGKSIFC